MRNAEEKKFVGSKHKKTSLAGVSSGVDPDPDPYVFLASRIQILPSKTKKSKENLDFYYKCDFFLTFYL